MQQGEAGSSRMQTAGGRRWFSTETFNMQVCLGVACNDSLRKLQSICAHLLPLLLVTQLMQERSVGRSPQRALLPASDSHAS